jgi:hypothetical protein
MTKMFGTRSLAKLTAVAAAGAVMLGCGDNLPAPVVLPAGAVVQGPVEGAVVFADSTTSGIRGALDDAEKPYSTTTKADGTFQIAAVPPYPYELISVGGVDKITNQPAITMRAEGGSGGSAVTTNVLTPLTTLVALTPAGPQRDAIKQTITSLGVDYKAKIDEGITPAAAALVKAITTTATQVVAVLNNAAGGTESNQQIPTTAVKAVQTELLTQLATNLAGKTAADLNSPTEIATIAQTATTTALNELAADPDKAGGLAVVVTAANLAMQVAATVNNVVTSIETASGGSLSTAASSIKPEAEVIQTAVAAIQASTSDAATSTIVTAANLQVETPINNPPTISVGTPPSTSAVGVAFSYTPVVADPDTGDVLTLSVAGVQGRAFPPGLTFNPTTGRISGTPTAAGTGIYTITVSDGIESRSITVTLSFFHVTGTTGATF